MTRARDVANSTTALSVDGTVKLDGNYPVGTSNVALGDAALDDGSLSGGYNIAIGSKSMTATTSGQQNTAIGRRSLFSNTTGSYNSALGLHSLYTNTTGSNNVAIGIDALSLNTTASNNTAVGYQAMYSYQTGGDNVALGTQAGYSINGNGNSTFIGRSAGYSTTGGNNTFIGYNSGNSVTSGSKNTIVGLYNGNQGGLDIRTSSNNIVLSDGDGNPRVKVDANGFMQVGTNAHFTGGGMGGVTDGNSFSPTRLNLANSNSGVSNRSLDLIKTGTATGNLVNIYYGGSTIVGSISITSSATSYNTSSDYRLKENVVYDWDATTRLKQLKPARFNFINDADTTVDGFLAHEAQAVVPEAVNGTHNEVDDDGAAVMQGIDQSKLVPLLVKTIQELEARITALEGA